MTDFGIHGLPEPLEAVDRLTHYRNLLGQLPAQFSTVWISDHLQFGSDPVAEAWTMLTYLAAQFTRFRYGHLVLSQSYRNPALLAKMAATLQTLTGGRLILGLGAGWHDEEYRAYDFDYPSGGIRVAQLAETIELIRTMWTESPATYHGTYYEVVGAYCEPRPDPTPPILVGTNGPKALGVTARLADMWNWDGPWDAVYREPYERLREHCAAIGRPFEEIALTASIDVSLPADPATFVPTYEHTFYPGALFHVLGPTPADAIRELELLVDVGVGHIQVSFDTMTTFRRFLDEVVPVVRLVRRAPAAAPGPPGRRTQSAARR